LKRSTHANINISSFGRFNKNEQYPLLLLPSEQWAMVEVLAREQSALVESEYQTLLKKSTSYVAESNGLRVQLREIAIHRMIKHITGSFLEPGVTFMNETIEPARLYGLGFTDPQRKFIETICPSYNTLNESFLRRWNNMTLGCAAPEDFLSLPHHYKPIRYHEVPYTYDPYSLPIVPSEAFISVPGFQRTSESDQVAFVYRPSTHHLPYRKTIRGRLWN